MDEKTPSSEVENKGYHPVPFHTVTFYDINITPELFYLRVGAAMGDGKGLYSDGVRCLALSPSCVKRLAADLTKAVKMFEDSFGRIITDWSAQQKAFGTQSGDDSKPDD